MLLEYEWYDTSSGWRHEIEDYQQLEDYILITPVNDRPYTIKNNLKKYLRYIKIDGKFILKDGVDVEDVVVNKLLYPYKKGDGWLLNSSKEDTLIFINDKTKVEVCKGCKRKYIIYYRCYTNYCDSDVELVRYLNTLGILKK